MGPGAIQLTHILKSDASLAKALEKPSTPAFEATYMDSPFKLRLTAIVEKLIIDPFFSLIISGKKACVA